MLKEDNKEKIEIYSDLLLKWSKVHNLISKKNQENLIKKNIEDSLMGLSYIKSGEVYADAGTGAGFPGVILAISKENSFFKLIDSDRKKCSFLRQVKSELGLKNVEIINDRIEFLGGFSFLLSKAAFSVENLDILTRAASREAKILLWSDEKFRKNCSLIFNNHGFKLVKYDDYKIINSKERALLLFERCFT